MSIITQLMQRENSYHVSLIQGLLPVIQLFLKESLLFTEQLLQQGLIVVGKIEINTINKNIKSCVDSKLDKKM